MIEKERELYKKLYTDLIFAYDDLRNMLHEEELEKRSFINKIETLKDYMEFLDKLEKENSKDKGFFKKLFNNDDKEIEFQINKYLSPDKRLKLKKLEKCNMCKCKNCVSNCNMNQCYNCLEEEYVHECDKENTLMTYSTDTVTLYVEDEEYIFNIAAYLIQKSEEGDLIRYIYLIDKCDYDNQQLLRYYKFKGEEYFDSVIGEDDSQDLLEEINNKFIEMGLRV